MGSDEESEESENMEYVLQVSNIVVDDVVAVAVAVAVVVVDDDVTDDVLLSLYAIFFVS